MTDRRSPPSPTGQALPPPASGRGATLRCASCGEVNDRRRELCRACGLDLDPNARTSVPVTGSRPAAPARSRWLPRRWWVLPLALVATVVAVAAGLRLVEAGPFAPAVDPLPVLPFPAQRYPDGPVALELSDVGTVTTARDEDGRATSPAGMVDADPATAWRGDPNVLPAGVLETIDVTLDEPAWLDAIVLANGDHRDAEAYEASGRIERLELWVDGDLHLDIALLDLGRERQIARLPEPLLTTGVRLVVVMTTAGSEHTGPALSALELRGYPADEEDAEVAASRAAQRGVLSAPVRAQRPSGLRARPAGQRS
ncbi:MAG: NADase-type glycan-binding domain-containing protein [Nitriliruptoraceae bacterium]